MWGRSLGGASLAAVLLVTGCSSGEPDAAPTTIGGEAPSSQPSVTEPVGAGPSSEPSVAAAPVMPELATQQTPEGAVAFAEWWFDTLNYAFSTGDTQPLREVSPEGCGTCDNVIADVDSIYGRSSLLEGGEIIVITAFAPDGQPDPARIEVLLRIDQAEATEITSSGARVAFSDAGTTSFTFRALWDGGWVAAGVVPNA